MRMAKKIGSEFGEMLFTHFGVSGPIILSLSKCVAEAFAKGAQDVELAIDLKPALDKDKLDARLQRDFTQYSRKQMPNGMKDLLPQRLIAPVLDQAFIDEEKFVNQLSRAERRRLVDVFKSIYGAHYRHKADSGSHCNGRRRKPEGNRP